MNDGPTASHFEVTIEPQATPPVVVATGELDAASSVDLGQALDAALEAGKGITLDLSAVTFLDSSALRVVIAALRRARDEGQPFSVPDASDAVRRLFEITGLNSFLAA